MSWHDFGWYAAARAGDWPGMRPSRPDPLPSRSREREGDGGAGPACEPSELDAELTLLTYEVIAAESRCALCGHRLRGRLAMDVHRTVPTGVAWSASVATRCRGWRRHRNAAVVDLVGGTLRLGRFTSV